MTQAFFVALLGVVLAQAAPGPNMAAVASAALAQGRRAALLTVLGVATGMLVWAAAVAFGLAAVIALCPWLLGAMKVAGGAYLLVLALKAARAAARGGERRPDLAPARRTGFRAWRRGLAVILANPKTALMWTAVATFLFGEGLPVSAVLAFGPVAFLSASLVYGGYALLFSTGLAARAYARLARIIESLFGLTFGALGGKLLADGFRELRT